MTSEAQKRARDKWDAKHPENKNYRVAKSTAKRFVSKLAMIEDLNMIDDLSKKRRQELLKNNKER